MNDPNRAALTTRSRFVSPDTDAVIEAVIDAQPPFTAKISFPLPVPSLSPHHWMRAGWESSGPHRQGALVCGTLLHRLARTEAIAVPFKSSQNQHWI